MDFMVLEHLETQGSFSWSYTAPNGKVWLIFHPCHFNLQDLFLVQSGNLFLERSDVDSARHLRIGKSCGRGSRRL